MPDIRLQDYVVKIKELIRSVRLDEAIAHSQHILRHYPKHIETYSLLGEACLEKEMYREAIEFFQRTLGADPENLMARVGLGVIYDEQGAFPEAIWQLERAFELVPGNSEVRRELLRLYGQYDEIDKTRLKLTRGALGRLYSRNGLYERAIGEFHAVLRQDPELPDIRVALVEALWREGRQLEAVEMCMELLDALPNCLKANLILGDIWLRGSNEESAEQRLSVARALDPENTVAQELMGKDSPLPPEEVFIPELDAIPDDFDLATSGVPGAGAIVAAEAVEMVAVGVPDEEEQEPWSTDEELPEWLRDVGVTAEEEPALELMPDDAVLDPPPDESIPAEDMPEWLQEVMGEEGMPPVGELVTAEDETFDDELVAGEETPESLQETESPDLADAAAAATRVGVAGGAAIAAGLMAADMMDDEDEESTGAEMTAEEMPEWLEELVGEAEPPLGEEPAPEEEAFAVPPVAEVEVETPAIEEEAPPAGEAPPDGESPDWLGELGTAGVAGAAGVAALSVADAEEEALLADETPPDGEAPDWLGELDTADVEEIAAPPAVDADEESPALEGETLPDDEAPPDDEIPDWLRDLGVAEVEEAAEPPVAEIETEELAALPVAEVEEESLPAEEAPPDSEVPDWLRDLDAADVEEVAEPVIAEVETEQPSALPVEEVEEEALPAGEAPPDGEVPDWLRDLDSADVEEVAEAEEAPAVTEEVPLIDEIPDWLRDLDDVEVVEVSAPPVGEVGTEAVQEGAVPASLLALVAAGLLDESDLESAMAEMSDEELAAQRAEEVPEWLSELVEEEEPAVAEAEPAPGTPFIQEIAIPVTERPVEEESPVAEPEPESLVEEAVLEVEEPESEVIVEEAVLEAVEPEPQPLVEEAVLEVEEPEAEVIVEEAVQEISEPEEEVIVEEAVLEVEEPEAEAIVEEAVLEIPEPEARVVIEEAVLEAVEPDPEPLVEEAAPDAVEPEAEELVEEAAPDAVEPEAEPLFEEAVLEVAEEETTAPERADELLQQLKTRPRDYSSRLELARLYYDDQNWDAALTNYEKLISARRFLPDIIDDLESLAEQDVEPARVYHMLGDAYMQHDQLDEALEMYRLARQKLTKR